MPTTHPPARPARSLVILFAVSCGITVANLYYAQPLLHTIAGDLGTGSATAGLIVTFSQIGYAIGLALLVPLGDLLPRRRLVPAVLSVTTLGLIVCATASTISVLVAVALVVGAGCVVAQMLVPLAASLSAPEHRGEVVGSVMSGLLLGILLARTVSGFVAAVASWRVVYIAGAVLTAVTALVLGRCLPAETDRPRMRYRRLLASTVELFATEPLLRRRALFGALGFAAFSVFWTTVAFLLSGPPFHYDDLTIGLFGLGGAAGALIANVAGRWVDGGHSALTTGAFALCVAASFGILWVGRQSVLPVIVGILVLDAGVQGLQVTNQAIIYRLAPSAGSRVTSAYMVCYFLGGAAGSAAAGSLYAGSGWAGVCVLGGAIGAVALIGALLDAWLPVRAERRALEPTAT